MSPRKTRGSGKISRRTALAMIAGGGLASLGFSGAFSSIKGPRPLNIGTKDDDTALLELVGKGTPLNTATISYTVDDGDSKTLVDVTNSVGGEIRFETLELQDGQGNTLGDLTSGATLEADSVDITITADSLHQGDTLKPGESTHIEATINCGQCSGGTTSTVQLSLKAKEQSSNPTTIELTRPIELTCLADCVACNSSTELVKYEWIACGDDGGEDGGDDEDCDDDDEDGDGGAGSFVVECSTDPEISLKSRTLDSESEPTKATFSTGYCGVDATVKAGTNEQTYTNQCGEFTVTEIDGKAISHVRFDCAAESSGGGNLSLPSFTCPTLCGNLAFSNPLPDGIKDDVRSGASCSSINTTLEDNGITLNDPAIGVNVLCNNIDDVELTPSNPSAINSRRAYIGTISTGNDLKLTKHATLIADGDITAANVGLDQGAAIASSGTVTANGNVDIDSGTVIGDIECTNGGFAITANASTDAHVCGSLIAKNGANVDIDRGAVVSGDVDLEDGGDFNVDNSTVGGNVVQGANLNISGSTICGYVTSENGSTKIDIDDGSKVGGYAVTSGGGDVQVTKSEVHGKAQTDNGGNVKVEQDSIVKGGAVTDGGGNVKVTGGSSRPSKVGGDAKTSGGGNVTVKAESEVGGTVSTAGGGNIQIKEGATVHGDVLTTDGSGTIKIEGDSTVKGDVALQTDRGRASGSVTVTGNSTVEGDITGVKPGNLTISDDSTVEGDYPGGDDDDDEDCDTDDD